MGDINYADAIGALLTAVASYRRRGMRESESGDLRGMWRRIGVRFSDALLCRHRDEEARRWRGRGRFLEGRFNVDDCCSIVGLALVFVDGCCSIVGLALCLRRRLSV